jgi:hypothetical protein
MQSAGFFPVSSHDLTYRVGHKELFHKGLVYDALPRQLSLVISIDRVLRSVREDWDRKMADLTRLIASLEAVQGAHDLVPPVESSIPLTRQLLFFCNLGKVRPGSHAQSAS